MIDATGDDSGGMEPLTDTGPCAVCGWRPAAYSYAWDVMLCWACRYLRTQAEVVDGGRHPVMAQCSCENCQAATVVVAADGGS